MISYEIPFTHAPAVCVQTDITSDDVIPEDNDI